MKSRETPCQSRARRIVIAIAAAAFITAPVQASAPPQTAADDSLPDAPGKQLVLETCTQCHEESRFAAKRMSAADWSQLIVSMQANGLQISDAEFATVLNYFATNLNLAPAKINVNKATADDLKAALALTDKEASAIVKYRTDHGDFKDWRQVAAVDGVDPKKIQAKKDSLTF
jgi:competence protein ComEA